MRAAILTGIAKDAPELEIQLLYVAKEYLTLAILSEQPTPLQIRRPTSYLCEGKADMVWDFSQCALMIQSRLAHQFIL